MLQGLGLRDPGEGFSKNRFDQVEKPQGDLSIIPDPELQIFPKLGMEDCQAFRHGISALRTVQANRLPKLPDSLGSSLPAPGAAQRPEQPLRVARRAEKVSRLGQARKLRRGHDGHVLRTAPMDDHRLPALGDFIAKGREPCPGGGIGDFRSHVQGFCTDARAKSSRPPGNGPAPAAPAWNCPGESASDFYRSPQEAVVGHKTGPYPRFSTTRQSSAYLTSGNTSSSSSPTTSARTRRAGKDRRRRPQDVARRPGHDDRAVKSGARSHSHRPDPRPYSFRSSRRGSPGRGRSTRA